MELMQDKAGVRVKPQGAQWHAVVRSRLAGRFEGIARIVSGRKSGAALEFDLIRYGSSAMSLEVRAGGRRAYLKLFDPAHTDYAYQREKAALCALRESGLVPRILAYADKPRFLLCEWSGAAAETEGNASLSPTQFAEKLGVWLAEQDRTDEAEGELVMAYETFVSYKLSPVDRIVATCEAIADICEKSGRSDEAQKWRGCVVSDRAVREPGVK